MTMDQLLDGSACSMLSALREREVSALELCDAMIDRIEKRDVAINAVVVRDFDRARDSARAADSQRHAGASGPLLGLPMTVKESFNIAGLPTTWGLESARDFVSGDDAVAIKRMKAAGAVILGKTNVPVLLADWQSVNPIYGRTMHPLDAARTPGGSSGGSAAAVAAGMSPLEIGSDIGGSIRVPAHFCGVYGHKPSHGLCPKRGQDLPGTSGAPDILSVIGPLARSAQDLDLALSVLAGPDDDDAKALQLQLPAARHERIDQYRVLVLSEHARAAVDGSIRAAIHRVAGELERRGCHLEYESPFMPDLATAHDHYAKTLATIVSRNTAREREVISAHQWMRLLDHRHALRHHWRRFFEAYDVVLAPAFGSTAFEHITEMNWHTSTLTIDGQPTPYAAQLFWAGIATLPGLPATVVPIGQAMSGLPIGLQVIGPYLEDRSTIAMAAMIGTL